MMPSLTIGESNMATIQHVVMIPQLGVIDGDKPLMDWANSLDTEMIREINIDGIEAFKLGLYERTVPRPNEAMIAIMPLTLLKNREKFKRSVFLFSLVGYVNEKAVGQIIIIPKNSDFIRDIIMRCMRVSTKEGVMSVSYPLSDHPVVSTLATIGVLSLMNSNKIHGTDKR